MLDVTNPVIIFTASNGYLPGEIKRCKTDCFYSTIYNKKIEHMASKTYWIILLKLTTHIVSVSRAIEYKNPL